MAVRVGSCRRHVAKLSQGRLQPSWKRIPASPWTLDSTWHDNVGMLEILSVTGGYDDTVVLRDVDLVVPDGAVIALLGPNGAGKTTTLRLVSGLIRPMSGEVWLDGEDISALRPAERGKLGVCHIPEGRGIFPSLTVRDNFIVQAGNGDLSEVID